MKRIRKIFFSFLVLISITAGSFTAYGNDEMTKAAQARTAVVRLLVIGPNGAGTGTGFGVGKSGTDAEFFVTNWHVVTANGSFSYEDAAVYMLLDDETTVSSNGITLGKVAECEVLYAETRYPDVAVLRLKEAVSGIDTLPLRLADQGDIGKKVYTIGYPSSADVLSVNQNGNVTEQKIPGSVEAVSLDGGEISRILPLEAVGNTNCIVHHAHINHGNSGGPLIMEDGSVIGINTYGYGETNTMEYSVSIDIAYAMEVMDQLGIYYEMAGTPANPSADGLLLTVVGAAAVLLVLAVLVKGKKSAPAAAKDLIPLHPEQKSIPASMNKNAASIPQQPDRNAATETVYRLQGVKGTFAGRRFPLENELRIGRDPKRNNFLYPPDTKGISGAHCMFQVQSGTLTITDLGSTYGTVVNGRKIPAHQPYPLHYGDRICLGSVNEAFQITKKGGQV